MASSCPCGCGRNIGFVPRCLAKRAVYIGSLIAVAERVRERAGNDHDADEASTFLRLGEHHRDVYLAVAHGVDNGIRDSAAEFKTFRASADAWEARALGLARRLRVEDHEWHATWPGPSYRVPTAPAVIDAEIDGAGLIPSPELGHTDVRLDAVAPAPSTEPSETAAGPTCIFCDEPAGSVEFLWPDWICRNFVAQCAARTTSDSFVEQLRSEVERTVAGVCTSCVHGWIQRLDDDVIAFLPAMIAGDDVRLTPRQQAVLARWGAKTAAVVECLYGDPAPVPRAAYARLRRGDVHPGTQVLAGRYTGIARALAHDRDVFRRTVDGSEHRLAQSTLVIGKLLVQVFTDPWRNTSPEISEDASPILIALIPRRRRKAQWPPAVAIDDSIYDLVRRGEVDETSDAFVTTQPITA